jgi:hypothetical protein
MRMDSSGRAGSVAAGVEVLPGVSVCSGVEVSVGAAVSVCVGASVRTAVGETAGVPGTGVGTQPAARSTAKKIKANFLEPIDNLPIFLFQCGRILSYR